MTEGAVLENGWTYLEIAPHLMLSATNVLSPWDLPRQASATASELRVSHACTSMLSSSEAVSCDGKAIDLLPELLTRLGCASLSRTRFATTPGSLTRGRPEDSSFGKLRMWHLTGPNA